MVESGYFLIRSRHKIGASIYLANLNIAADRRQIASVLLGLISSLLACMQLNGALLNAEISYARRFWVRPGRTSAWWDNFVNPQ